MKYKNLVVAFAAVALTVGFSACSDDEDVTGKYELEVNVHADAMGSDVQEFVSICNAYRTAIGLDELNANTENESVCFTGKDSLDCVASIQKCCAQAEMALNGKTWEDKNVISIRDANTNAPIYIKQYGSSADNSITTHTFDKVDSDFLIVKNIPSHFWVTFVHIDSRSNCISPFTSFWQDNYVGRDLNVGAGGNYVYPSYSGFVVNDEVGVSDSFVGGMLVLKNESGLEPPTEFKFENCLYTIAKDVCNRAYSFDLNHKAGGSYLYLYTTRSSNTGKVLRGDWSKIVTADHDITSNESNLVRGVTYWSNQTITLTYPKGIDLNEGAGGDWVYWREIYDTPRY